MTDSSSIIQQARDVLAKWRQWMSPDPWTISEAAVKDTSGTTIVDYGDVQNLVARHAARQNLRLIVGTAGNPDLLDAIDEILDRGAYEADDSSTNGRFVFRRARRIARAIVAADERMSA